MDKLLFVLHSHKAGKIGCASTMTRKKKIFLSLCSACTTVPYLAVGQDRLRLNNGKKKKDFLVIVFGLHYLCIEFAVFGLLITLQNQNSS